ncbi:MAG: hypothetical protein ACYTG2_03075 [Planctomycetota bacterium]|jgi:hypothetical protein
MNPALPILLLQATEPRMDAPSWIFLGLAWIVVAGLAIWCFRRVLRSPPSP